MAAIKDFYLQEERDKLQSQLTLLDDILRKKAEFEAEHKKFLDIKADVQQLSTKLATLEENLAVQQAQIERDIKDHKIKKQQWKEKSDKFDCILFKDDVSLNASEPDSYDLDQLEITAELAKENSNLFAQLLHIREMKKGVRSWQSVIDETKLSLSTKEKLREGLERLCPLLKSVFEKSEAEFHRNNETEQLQKQIKTMGSRNSQLESNISELQRSTEAKDKIINNQKSKVLRLESDLRTKDQVVDNLQRKVSFLSVNDDPQLEPLVDAADKTINEKLILAFKKGLSLNYRRLGPLAIAGRYIRERKLEWQKKAGQDKALVELGNLSSHYGMALVDATFFQDFCPSPRTDFNNYTDLYVLHPNFVWKH
jgi:archaellum component FlaC